MLRSAPVVSPRYLETWSVAQHSLSARGMTARQLRTKTTESLHPRWGASTPAGTKTRRILLQFLMENLAATLSLRLRVEPSFSRSTGKKSRASYRWSEKMVAAHRRHKHTGGRVTEVRCSRIRYPAEGRLVTRRAVTSVTLRARFHLSSISWSSGVESLSSSATV